MSEVKQTALLSKIEKLITKILQILIILISLNLISCKADEKTLVEPKSTDSMSKLFQNLYSKETGIDFNNKIVETKELNYYNYVYLYNGGGVGIADINNDGLPDLYFTSTQGKDKLYLNKGNFEFEDISTSSGIDNFTGYKTGVTFVDINNDGWLDIYVCRSGWSQNPKEKENLLFINTKKNTFTESAATYGLDYKGQSIQSIFFDYDKDGDLDMYLANHPKVFNQPMAKMIANTKNPNQQDSDKLFKNNGNGTYTDVSIAAGILNYSYSLGIAAGDLNQDGWTDLYVTSDFQPRDLYYINNGDGTFKESLKDYFPHCSYFAMGVDLADINSDGYLDIFTGEMLSEDNTRQKTQMAPMDINRFSDMVSNGMHYQYMRNALHLNNGNGHFSDIAHYSGIDKSDWSWSTLFGDYDQDGDEDLIIANGWLKDTQDKDFSKKSNALAKKNKNRLTFNQAYSLLKSTPLKNYAFSQEDNLKFSKKSKEWGFDIEGFSNGMATGDLDGDGDLDIVINNINSTASILKNTANNNDYIKIKLKGSEKNNFGYNTKVYVTTAKDKKFKEFQVSRGFQSSCEPFIHFGLKSEDIIESIKVVWPDGKSQILNEATRGEITLNYSDATNQKEVETKAKPLLAVQNMIDFLHKEKFHDDYKVQVLLPHLLSQLGPGIAKGDVNNDGLQDVYIGGAAGQAGKIYIQSTQNGIMKSNQTLKVTQFTENVDAKFFDADNDGDLDLYIASGSNEFKEGAKELRDYIYLNNGQGQFKVSNLLPDIIINTGCVAAADYDNDGDIDLFVGGRQIHGAYPNPARSVLLENTKEGFKDVTKQNSKELMYPGMISTAIWSDYDSDGDKDLLIAGEWTEIMVYNNNKGKLELTSSAVTKKLVGWWNCIKAADIDGDGDEDYIVGNLGENYKYQASEEAPFEVFAGDFDKSGIQDIVVSYYYDETLYPVRGFQCSSEQVPELKSKIGSYEEFGKSDVFKVYGSALDSALHYKANNFSSVVLWNNKGKLIPEKLPYQAQLAPIQDCVFEDVDGDKDLDLIIAGNWYVAEIETSRADNGVGLLLINEGDHSFSSMPSNLSGLFAKDDVRNMISIKDKKGKTHIIIANNNSKVKTFKLN